MASESVLYPGIPSAILTNGAVTVPLFAVTRMALSETYRLPPVGSLGYRTVTDTSEDSINIGALLVGQSRFIEKTMLEMLADVSRRADILGNIPGGFGGIALISRMTTRTNLHVTSLSFSANAQRRDAIDAAIGLRHVPKPGPADMLLDVAATIVNSAVPF